MRRLLPLGWPYWWAAVAMSTLAQGTMLMDRTALYPLLPVIGKALDLTGAQLGAIASAYAVVYVAVQIPGGLLGDRLGLKRVLAASLFLSGLALLAVGLWARSYYSVLVLMAVHGLGAGGIWPLANSLAIDATPARRRGSSISLLYSGGSLGMMLGLGIPGIVYGMTGHWWAAFLFLSGPTLLLAATCLAGLRKASYSSAYGGLGSFKPILGHRQIMFLCLANFCSLYGMWTLFTWGPTYLKLERGLSLQWAGGFTALMAGMAIPGALVMGQLTDRWGRKRLAVSLVSLAAATIAALATVGNPALLLGLLAVYGLIGPMALGTAIYAWLVDMVTASRLPLATALGVFSAISMGSSFLAPVLSGWLWDVSGSLRVSFYAAAGMVLMGSLVMLLLRETTARRAPQVTPAVGPGVPAPGPAAGPEATGITR